MHRRLVTVYAISAAIAGVAGALFTQTNAYVTLAVFDFDNSAKVMVMLILGGAGRLYGPFLGAAVYMILEDYFSKLSPTFWQLGIGLLLVLAVLFARRGLLGLAEDARSLLAGSERGSFASRRLLWKRDYWSAIGSSAFDGAVIGFLAGFAVNLKEADLMTSYVTGMPARAIIFTLGGAAIGAAINAGRLAYRQPHCGRGAAVMTAAALQVEGLNRAFGALPVTRDVNLTLERGARRALIGPNGAGKTTLVNPRLNGLVNGDLAGDVEIVGAGAQATFDQRLGGVFEWPGAVQHDRDTIERAVDRGGIVEPEGAPLEASLTGDAVELSDVPSGHDRLYAQAACCTCDMLANVTVGPVDHCSGRHQNPLPCGVPGVAGWASLVGPFKRPTSSPSAAMRVSIGSRS